MGYWLIYIQKFDFYRFTSPGTFRGLRSSGEILNQNLNPITVGEEVLEGIVFSS